MPNTMTLIASSTVGAGGAASIDFTSIPNTYTDLCLKLSGRASTTAGDLAIQLNGSAASFSRKTLRGNGATASSTGASDNYIGIICGSGDTANTFSNVEIYIPNYAGSTNKSISSDSVTENNGTTAYAYMIASLWSNTAAITSIKLLDFASSFSFVQHSSAYLYGIVKS